MRTQLIGSAALVAATVMAAGSAARAAVITTSGSAPASAAISQPDFSGPAFNGAQDFTDNAGPPGQTFTVGAAPVVLTGLTVKGFANTPASFGGNVNTGTWTITVSRVGTDNILTRVDQETAVPTAVTNGAAYVTVTFDQGSPVTLAAGTTYAFDIFSSSGYFGLAKSSSDVYAGGVAMQHGTTARTSADNATLANPQTADRTFFINPVVPEPTGVALLVVAVFGVLGRRRRR